MLEGCIVSYTRVGKTNLTKTMRVYLNAHTDTVSVHLDGLEKFTNYCIQVAWFTSVSSGIMSECFYVQTDEDGKVEKKLSGIIYTEYQIRGRLRISEVFVCEKREAKAPLEDDSRIC